MRKTKEITCQGLFKYIKKEHPNIKLTLGQKTLIKSFFGKEGKIILCKMARQSGKNFAIDLFREYIVRTMYEEIK